MQFQIENTSHIVSKEGLISFKGVGEPSPYRISQFQELLAPKGNYASVQRGIENVLTKVEARFSQKHNDIVDSIKRFEATGSAVSLMAASHEGANKSVIVQLFGAVGKKCADNAEQIYKQQ